MRILIQIILLLTTTTLFAQEDKGRIPIDKISFDKIIAFNYNLPDDTSYSNRVDFVVTNGRLHDKLIKPGKTLSLDQQRELISTLNDTSSYGDLWLACFEPRLVYVFYNKEKIVGYVEICFDCNQLESSMYIPAYDARFSTHQGFSSKGFVKLLKMCNDLNMIFCIEGEPEEEE